jgi:hypothetical protein
VSRESTGGGKSEEQGAIYAFYVYDYALCVRLERPLLSFRPRGEACSSQNYFNPTVGGL